MRYGSLFAIRSSPDREAYGPVLAIARKRGTLETVLETTPLVYSMNIPSNHQTWKEDLFYVETVIMQAYCKKKYNQNLPPIHTPYEGCSLAYSKPATSMI